VRVIRLAIVDALSNDSGVMALVGTAVYHSLAPDGSTMPYVIVAQQPGGGRERTFQKGVVMRRTRWLVKGVAETKLASENIDEACDLVLDNASGTAPLDVSPYNLMSSERDVDLTYAERDAGIVVHHTGGIYEIGVT
jgi:hypothetical protein